MFFWNLLLIFILVALNGFFVAIEFGVVASRRTRIEVLSAEGDNAAHIVKAWLETPRARDRLIAAAQLGITIVSLALGAVGENTFETLLDPYFHSLNLPPILDILSPVLTVLPLAISLVIVTSLHVVFGEQVPKVAALRNPEHTALLGAYPMSLFSMVFKWFVDVLDWATKKILKVFGLQLVGEHTLLYTVDELKQIVVESEAGGVIETPEREMLHAIFDLGDMLVQQVMIPRTEIVALEARTPLKDSIQTAARSIFTKFPVYEDDLDHIIGVVHIKDLLRAIEDPQGKTHVVRDLIREALFIPETVHIKSLLNLFRLRRQHIAIVVDEFGGTRGLVTLEDVLEEIVGEVSDPFDAIQPEIQILSDGSALIDGLALIEDVNETLGLNLQDQNYNTIAGFYLGKLGRIPKIGDTVESDGLVLKVKEMDGLRIARISLRHQKEPLLLTPAEK
ncbi:MAG: hemolysin family protein [Chloroflexota bacterium]